MDRIGIDLGGTKTEIVVLDEVYGTELYRRRVSTERSYDGVVRGIRDLVEAAERVVGTRGTELFAAHLWSPFQSALYCAP